jgi:hypothetical protein
MTHSPTRTLRPSLTVSKRSNHQITSTLAVMTSGSLEQEALIKTNWGSRAKSNGGNNAYCLGNTKRALCATAHSVIAPNSSENQRATCKAKLLPTSGWGAAL